MKKNSLIMRLAAGLILILGTPGIRSETITLNIPDATGRAGGEVEVPILISGAKKTGPIGFVIDFDPDVLRVIADPPGVEPRGVVLGEAGNGWIESDPSQEGRLGVTLVTNEAIQSDGPLVIVRFEAIGEDGDEADLFLNQIEAWEDETGYEVRVETEPGQVTLSSAGFGLPLPLLIAIVAGVVLLVLVVLVRLRRGSRGKPAPSVEGPAPAVAQPIASAEIPAESPADKLKKLKEMLEAGLISQEDFDAKKQQFLDQL